LCSLHSAHANLTINTKLHEHYSIANVARPREERRRRRQQAQALACRLDVNDTATFIYGVVAFDGVTVVFVIFIGNDIDGGSAQGVAEPAWLPLAD
jgi:hypothetical protein